MRILKPSALLVVALLLFTSCKEHGDSPLIPLYRFEQLMFDTPAKELPQRLYDEAPRYHNTLLNVSPTDPHYLMQVQEMSQDPVLREIYDTITLHYNDLTPMQEELSQAFARAHALDSNMHCEKIITFVSGLLDYTHRVAANESSLLIAIDQYVVPSFQKYGCFDLPQYLVNLCTSEHIVPDALGAFARSHIVMNHDAQEPMLLDYIVAEGKVLYFLDQVLPHTADTLKIRYTQAQWEWAEENANQVWAYWLQHDLLFSRNHKDLFNFIDDAPKTNAFGESAPRMTAYIGWQIVNQYMKQTDNDLHTLFNTPDALLILKQSGWKPKR